MDDPQQINEPRTNSTILSPLPWSSNP